MNLSKTYQSVKREYTTFLLRSEMKPVSAWALEVLEIVCLFMGAGNSSNLICLPSNVCGPNDFSCRQYCYSGITARQCLSPFREKVGRERMTCDRNIFSSAKKIRTKTPLTATQILSKNLRKLEWIFFKSWTNLQIKMSHFLVLMKTRNTPRKVETFCDLLALAEMK